MIDKLAKLLIPLTKNQTFVVVIIGIILYSAYLFAKEDRLYRAVKENTASFKELMQVIKEREIGALNKPAAAFVFEQTLNSAKYRISKEVSKIILQNNISSVYRQIEVKDILNHRVKYFYKMDYSGLNEFSYNGVPLSYFIRDVRTDVITDKVTDYIYEHHTDNYQSIMGETDRLLDNIFSEIYTDIIEQINKL